MAMGRLDPAAQRRLASCLTLAKRGATAGERAAAKAAAERIAAAASLTIDEAKASKGTPESNPAPPNWTPPPEWAAAWRRARATPRRPRKPPKPPTVADRLREKAEQDADRRRRAAVADRKLLKELAEQAAWEAEQRAAQAERDQAWAARQMERA